MLKTLAAVVVALVMSSALAFAGDPVGRYSVVGSNRAARTDIREPSRSSAPARHSG